MSLYLAYKSFKGVFYFFFIVHALGTLLAERSNIKTYYFNVKTEMEVIAGFCVKITMPDVVGSRPSQPSQPSWPQKCCTPLYVCVLLISKF